MIKQDKVETIDLDEYLYDGVIRLEITGGIPTWEASPGMIHQEVIDLIRPSIKPIAEDSSGRDCLHYSDLTIRFPDGSVKRPDISIYCKRPRRRYGTISEIPQAVIEIVSPGYEYKDYELNPGFYLAQGIEDVIIYDPRTGGATHYQDNAKRYYNAPTTIDLQSGCRCTIPIAPAEEDENGDH